MSLKKNIVKKKALSEFIPPQSLQLSILIHVIFLLPFLSFTTPSSPNDCLHLTFGPNSPLCMRYKWTYTVLYCTNETTHLLTYSIFHLRTSLCYPHPTNYRHLTPHIRLFNGHLSDWTWVNQLPCCWWMTGTKSLCRLIAFLSPHWMHWLDFHQLTRQEAQ